MSFTEVTPQAGGLWQIVVLPALVLDRILSCECQRMRRSILRGIRVDSWIVSGIQ
jgi:hypothetical protein